MPSYYKDLTGMVFERLTVLREAGRTAQMSVLWECKCSCGNTIICSSGSLKSGNTKSCGCYINDIRKSRAKDVTGLRFGKLVAIRRVDGAKYTSWECRCDCGKTTVASLSNLSSGTTKSCGCHNSAVASKRWKTHGLSSTPEYYVYRDMMRRCYNPSFKNFHLWGGRGIEVDLCWRGNPEAFVEWAKENGYEKGLTLERINNDGPYSPDNCKWATYTEQGNNRRNNYIITSSSGESHTITEWSKLLGICVGTIKQRISKNLPIDLVLSPGRLRRNSSHAHHTL